MSGFTFNLQNMNEKTVKTALKIKECESVSIHVRRGDFLLEDNRQGICTLDDLGDSMSMVSVVGIVRPDEIYNPTAQSHVQVSFDVPEFTVDIDAAGVLRVLEAVRICGLADI